MPSRCFNPSGIVRLAKTLSSSHLPRSAAITASPHRTFVPSPVSRSSIWDSPPHSRSFHLSGKPKSEPVPDHQDGYSPQELYDKSLSLSRTPLNSTIKMKPTLYDEQGTALSTSEMTKLDIAEKYGLSTRDLRALDLASYGFPHILIRDKTMLVHMFHLRLLVQADRVLFFHVKERAGHEQDNASRLFCHHIEGKLCGGELTSAVSVELPYELRVLEAALASVTSTLEAEYLLAKRQVSEALESLHLKMLDKGENAIHSQQRTLLDVVRRLADIEQRVRQVRSAIQDVLNEDEDMAAMYLTDKRAGNPHAIQDHQSVEYLLEAYYKASDAVVQEAGSLMKNIRRTEESIQSVLNVRRNQIVMLEAKIEILMLGLASATLVAGLYGMNVVNFFEESEVAFGVLGGLCLVGTALTWRFGLRQLRKIQRVRI